MLKYVTDKVFMKEFGYQLCTRLSQQLQMSNKSPWPIFPLQIGLYELKNLKEIEVDIKELNSLTCDRMSFHQYDPRDVWKQHFEKMRYTYPYEFFSWEDEENTKNRYNVSKEIGPGDEVGASHIVNLLDIDQEGTQQKVVALLNV